MDIKDVKDYNVANISEEDITSITKLEESLSSKVQQDIVLIAYSSSSKAQV